MDDGRRWVVDESTTWLIGRRWIVEDNVDTGLFGTVMLGSFSLVCCSVSLFTFYCVSLLVASFTFGLSKGHSNKSTHVHSLLSLYVCVIATNKALPSSLSSSALRTLGPTRPWSEKLLLNPLVLVNPPAPAK